MREVGAWQGTPEAKPRNGLRRAKAGGEQWDNPPATGGRMAAEHKTKPTAREWETRIADGLQALLAMGYGTLRVEVAKGEVTFVIVEMKYKIEEGKDG